MRRLRKISILCLAVVLVCSCGVSKFKEVKFNSFELESFVPSGLRSFDAVVELGIDNPAPSFKVENLKATVRKDSLDVMYLSSEGLSVDAKSNKTYTLPVQGKLSKDFSLMQLAGMAARFDPEGYIIDITADANAKGIKKKIEYKDMPLSKFMNE